MAIVENELSDQNLTDLKVAPSRLQELTVVNFSENYLKKVKALLETFKKNLNEHENKRKQSLEIELVELSLHLAKMRYPVVVDAVTPIKEEVNQLNLCMLKNRMSTNEFILDVIRSEAALAQNCSSMLKEKIAKGKKLHQGNVIRKSRSFKFPVT